MCSSSEPADSNVSKFIPCTVGERRFGYTYRVVDIYKNTRFVSGVNAWYRNQRSRCSIATIDHVKLAARDLIVIFVSTIFPLYICTTCTYVELSTTECGGRVKSNVLYPNKVLT